MCPHTSALSYHHHLPAEQRQTNNMAELSSSPLPTAPPGSYTRSLFAACSPVHPVPPPTGSTAPRDSFAPFVSPPIWREPNTRTKRWKGTPALRLCRWQLPATGGGGRNIIGLDGRPVFEGTHGYKNVTKIPNASPDKSNHEGQMPRIQLISP